MSEEKEGFERKSIPKSMDRRRGCFGRSFFSREICRDEELAVWTGFDEENTLPVLVEENSGTLSGCGSSSSEFMSSEQ